MTARERILTRLQAIAQRSPEYKVGVAAGVWLDDLDALEAEAREPLLTAVRNYVIAMVRVDNGKYPPERAEERFRELLEAVERYGPAEEQLSE